MTAPEHRDRRDDWPSEMKRPEPEPPHAYERACRNMQHSGCVCMHPIDGRWCGRSRNDPIHAVERPEPEEQAAEIARHQSCTCEHHQAGGPFERHFCAWCGDPWPCLVRRLADERIALLLAGKALAEVCLAHAEVIRHLAASQTLLRAVDRWMRALAPGGEGEE